MAESKDEEKKAQERARSTIDEAREQGIGTPEEGAELTAPLYADPGGVADLGVDEPVVPGRLRGHSPPEPKHAEDGDQK